MVQPQVERKKYSIEEWLELEQSEGIRYEYYYGEVYAMAGGTISHDRIGKNAMFELESNFRSKGSNCETFTSDIKIEINEKGKYVYPDTLAVCGEVEESKNVAGAIINPVLVIEVASKSTETYDRTIKYEYYTSLPSVKQYLVVSQLQPFVTIYSRNPKTGDFDLPPAEVRGLMGAIDLFSVDYSLEMKALYRNVTFDKDQGFLHSVK